jgi:hypothetical protein
VLVLVVMAFISAVMVVIGLDVRPPLPERLVAVGETPEPTAEDGDAAGPATPVLGFSATPTSALDSGPLATPPPSFPQATVPILPTVGMPVATTAVPTRPDTVPTLPPPALPTYEPEIPEFPPTATNGVPGAPSPSTGTVTATASPTGGYPPPDSTDDINGYP